MHFSEWEKEGREKSCQQRDAITITVTIDTNKYANEIEQKMYSVLKWDILKR